LIFDVGTAVFLFEPSGGVNAPEEAVFISYGSEIFIAMAGVPHRLDPSAMVSAPDACSGQRMVGHVVISIENGGEDFFVKRIMDGEGIGVGNQPGSFRNHRLRSLRRPNPTTTLCLVREIGNGLKAPASSLPAE
jgi:hypothetical protein